MLNTSSSAPTLTHADQGGTAGAAAGWHQNTSRSVWPQTKDFGQTVRKAGDAIAGTEGSAWSGLLTGQPRIAIPFHKINARDIDKCVEWYKDAEEKNRFQAADAMGLHKAKHQKNHQIAFG